MPVQVAVRGITMTNLQTRPTGLLAMLAVATVALIALMESQAHNPVYGTLRLSLSRRQWSHLLAAVTISGGPTQAKR